MNNRKNIESLIKIKENHFKQRKLVHDNCLKQLKEMNKTYKIKQSEMASLFGVSIAAMSSYISNRKKASPETALKINRLYLIVKSTKLQDKTIWLNIVINKWLKNKE